MDNLGAHRPRRVRELIEARGCELLYLPSYSPSYPPDLNPIEGEALSKIKHIRRKTRARTKEHLIEAMGRALGAVSAQDVCGGSSLKLWLPPTGAATMKGAVSSPSHHCVRRRDARLRTHADHHERRLDPSGRQLVGLHPPVPTKMSQAHMGISPVGHHTARRCML